MSIYDLIQKSVSCERNLAPKFWEADRTAAILHFTCLVALCAKETLSWLCVWQSGAWEALPSVELTAAMRVKEWSRKFEKHNMLILVWDCASGNAYLLFIPSLLPLPSTALRWGTILWWLGRPQLGIFNRQLSNSYRATPAKWINDQHLQTFLQAGQLPELV